MSEIIKSEAISSRMALSLFGKVAAFAVAASTSALTVSDAEAQTVGMERRQERRAGRHERREVRRAARTERREVRRTGTNTSTGTTTGAAK
jgi:Ni/Co efflux regulator RcnB